MLKKLIIFLLFLIPNYVLAAASFEHFSGTSLPSSWTAVTGTNGVVCMNGTITNGSGGTCPAATTGETRLSLVTAATGDVAAVYSPVISRTTSAIYWFAVRGESQPGRIALVDHSAPVATTTASFTGATGYVLAMVQVGASSGTQVRLNRYNNARNQTDGNWDDSTKSWSNTATVSAMATDTDTYVLVGIEIDGTTPRWRLHGCGNYVAGSTVPNTALYCPLLTDWTNFSYHEGAGGFCNPTCSNLRFVLGDIVNNNDTTTVTYEYHDFHEGGLQYSFLNARDNGGTWRIYRFQGYNSVNGFVERFVPTDRGATISLNVGGAGAWDETHVKDPYVLAASNGTYYMCYGGARASDGKFSIGYATASSVTGTWTKGAGNPMVVLSAGTTEDQVANCAFVEDLTDPDASKRWKMFYIGVDTSAPIQRRLYVRTCSAPPDNAACDTAAEWSAKIELAGPGGAAAIDERGIGRAWPITYGGFPYISVSVISASLDQGSYIYNKNFTSSFTKSNVLTITAGGSNCSTTATNAMTTAIRSSILVGSTTGCNPDQYVVIDDDSSTPNGHLNRILRIDDGTHLTLYHKEQGHAAGATIRGIEAFISNEPGYPLEYSPGKWVAYGTCFRPFTSGGNPDFYNERVCTYRSNSPLGPWTRVELASPLAPGNAFGMQHSLENVSLVTKPLRNVSMFAGPR